MKMKRMKLIVLACVSFAISSAALAVCPLPCGWYAEGNVGSSHVSGVDYGEGVSVNTSGIGWNVNAGYKFMPYFSMDLGYTQYGTGNVKFEGVKVANITSRYSYQLVAKGILPLCDTGAQLFAKLGIARLAVRASAVDSDVDFDGSRTTSQYATGAYYGGGGEYYFSPSFAANLQWAMANSNNNSVGNMSLLSVGLSYIFS